MGQIKVNVLIGCEYSGVVRDAFIAAGHHAISVDLLPTESPVDSSVCIHHEGDLIDFVDQCNGASLFFDLLIAHPPCTYLSGSGLHWNKRVPGRAAKTEQALDFVRYIMDLDIPRIAIENPVGCISTRIDATLYGFDNAKAAQYIQPFDYGHDASKKTGLWLKNLPPLTADANNYVEPRLIEYPKNSGSIVKRWANQTDSGQNKLPPSATRAKDRAKFYTGWANAMADQWGK